MQYLLVKHRVKDFDRWYSVFRSHEEAQREAGLKDLQLFRDVADPNVVVVLFRVDDLDKVKAFTESPESYEAKEESGVIGEPEALWLNKI